MGPVQVLVIGFDRPTFSGEVLAELTRLREAGIVRLIDLLLVSRAEDGTLETLGPPEGIGAGLGGVAAALLAHTDGDDDDQAAAASSRAADGEPAGGDTDDVTACSSWSLASAVPPGCAAAVALIEHLWAGPLSEAIRNAGGQSLEETWLAAEDLRLLQELIDQAGTDPHAVS